MIEHSPVSPMDLDEELFLRGHGIQDVSPAEDVPQPLDAVTRFGVACVGLVGILSWLALIAATNAALRFIGWMIGG